MDNQGKNSCEICYKIVCRKCGWEPNDNEVSLIQSGVIEACIVCGWSPAVLRVE